MISTARRSRPLRQPPPRPALDAPGRVSLPVINPAFLAEGDPFSPHKILNHFDRLTRLAQGRLVYPVTVEIDPTNLCNHRCQWCVSAESHTGQSLGLDRFRSLIDELRRCDVRSIVLKGGGEPTAHPRFLDMLDILREGRLGTGLITNGSMPRPGTPERILDSCQWVRVSLDAATADTHCLIHGSTDFEKIVGNISYLTANARQTTVGLNFVAEERNCCEMAAFAELARSIGCAYVTIRCVFDPAHPMSQDLRDAMRQEAVAAKQLETPSFRVFLGNFTDRYLNADPSQLSVHPRCLGPNLIGIVGGDGEVYACCFLRGNMQFSLGSINQHTFREIWTGPRRREVMQAVYEGRCNKVCAGGQTANRYNLYNEILNYLACACKPHSDFA